MSVNMCEECRHLIGDLRQLMDAAHGPMREKVAGWIDLAAAIDRKRHDYHVALIEEKRENRRYARSAEASKRVVDALRKGQRLTDAERDSIAGRSYAMGFAEGEASGFGECAELMKGMGNDRARS